MSGNGSNSSSDSDNDNDPAPAPKRYKRPLYADYSAHEVSRQTRRKWHSFSSHLSHELSSIESVSYTVSLPALENKTVQLEGTSNSSDRIDIVGASVPVQVDTVQENYADTVKGPLVVEQVDTSAAVQGNYEVIEERDSNDYLSHQESFYESDGNSINVSDDSNNEFIHLDESELSDTESYFESDSDNDHHENEEYAFLNSVMFECSNMTVQDIILMTSAFSLRYQLSDEALLHLLEMIKCFAGKKNLNISKYRIQKYFSSQEQNITNHYYCKECSEAIVYSVNAKVKVKNHDSICEKCSTKNSIVASSSNYFMQIDLEYQLRMLLSNDLILQDLLKNDQSARNSGTSSLIRDVNDGQLYKKTMQLRGRNKESEIMLTLNLNTDGAPMTKSGKRAFWPVQLVLNELSPKFRFRLLLISGILIVMNEPKSNLLNLYLSKVFTEQINKLYSITGIAIKKHGIKYVFKFRLHCCTVDSVCRPIIQNRVQFNGYSSCSWCYQLGLYIHTVHGIRFIVEQDSINRTHNSNKEDVQHATDSGVIVKGVKGLSSFSDVPHVDMIWSFAYEYMHGLLLGVTFQIWKEWKCGKSQFKIKPADVKFIEKRYLSMTPTQNVHRLPRKGIIQGTAKPKASELKSWLLVFSLPCLSGILNEEALNHYCLLVKCAHVLLKTEISEEELVQCEKDLIKFVYFYEMLYGQEKMTFNVHSLLHIVESIRQTGPLLMNSAFPFESHIYTLKTYITGPNGMDHQMARKHLRSFYFKNGNVSNFSKSEDTRDYCHGLFIPKRLVKFCSDGPENIKYFGKSCLKKIKGINCIVYKKCIIQGRVFHSIEYNRAKKTDDTVVQLQDSGKFGRILNICNIDNQCYFHLHLFKIFSSYPFKGVHHIRKIELEDTSNSFLTPVDDIKEKVLLINGRNARYLCTLPNTIEIQ